MIIKRCATSVAKSIGELMELGVNWVGFDFRVNSPNFVRQISSRSGIIPDYGSRAAAMGKETEPTKFNPEGSLQRFGIFADDMPQNIVTRVVNFKLNVVQLDGEESCIMINNLRKTLDPDIHAGIKIMKTLPIRSIEDMKKTGTYEGAADYFLFKPDKMEDSLKAIRTYTGNTHFLIGSVSQEHLDLIRNFRHPMFLGADIDDCADVQAAIKVLEG